MVLPVLKLPKSEVGGAPKAGIHTEHSRTAAHTTTLLLPHRLVLLPARSAALGTTRFRGFGSPQQGRARTHALKHAAPTLQAHLALLPFALPRGAGRVPRGLPGLPKLENGQQEAAAHDCLCAQAAI